MPNISLYFLDVGISSASTRAFSSFPKTLSFGKPVCQFGKPMQSVAICSLRISRIN